MANSYARFDSGEPSVFSTARLAIVQVRQPQDPLGRFLVPARFLHSPRPPAAEPVSSRLGAPGSPGCQRNRRGPQWLILVGLMRIDPKGAIAGYPAVLVRDTLRRLRVHLDWNLARLESVAGLSPVESRAFVRAMVSAGLIERAGPGRWSITGAGQTTSSATAAARVTRATGDRALREFMARVERVNQDR